MYANGIQMEDEEEASRSINDITCDIDIVSNFTQLRVLKLKLECACLMGNIPTSSTSSISLLYSILNRQAYVGRR